MKKLLSLILSTLLLLAAFGTVAVAAEKSTDGITVYVTVAKGGELALTREAITVTDADKDNSITISDALYCAHEAKYEGGAAAGYNAYTGDYGLSLGKLWGDNSGNFGYWVNNATAWSLADTLKDGDSLSACVYVGTYPNLEDYAYFDVATASAKQGDSISLTLSKLGYDADWNTVTLPVEGATITVNGEATDYKTDADGKVTVTLDKSGTLTISAVCEASAINPPVCVATVEAAADTTGDTVTETEAQTSETEISTETEAEAEKASGCGSSVIYTGVSVFALAAIAALTVGKRKNEN